MTIRSHMMHALFAIGFLVGPMAPLSAQDMEARVVVPDAPGGAKFIGCYTANEDLYGPYRLSFCLQQRSTYKVRGRNLRCDGRLSWAVSGRDIRVRIDRTSCGNGVAWAEARMTCRGTTVIKGTLGKIAKVLVPDITLSGLRCTYDPSVRNEPSRTFNARRSS